MERMGELGGRVEDGVEWREWGIRVEKERVRGSGGGVLGVKDEWCVYGVDVVVERLFCIVGDLSV